MPDKIYDNGYNVTFRDTLQNYQKGKRQWVFPKKPRGKIHTYRLLVGYFLLVFFLVAPFVKLAGRPFLMFNFIERRFSLFGVMFFPQDSQIFFVIMMTLLVFIVLFTVVFGRLWCGWTCPQTIFMELIFRKIEYAIEGDAHRQRKLAAQVWNTEKIIKRVAKYTLFFLIAFIIANTVITYLIGSDEWLMRIQDPLAAPHHLLYKSLVFTIVIYFIYAFVREQICIIVCPYGRLQGIFVDTDTIVVTYDKLRGEPRRGISNDNQILGDCIDDKLCVQVCPTAIDIRNGTQLECINCAACVDVCRSVMDKVGKPRGLIRYASENEILNRQKGRLTTKGKAYITVLLILLSLLLYLFVSRPVVETTLLRTTGTLYQQRVDGEITNLYNLKVANKTIEKQYITLKLVEPELGQIKQITPKMVVDPTSTQEFVLFVEIAHGKIESKAMSVEIDVFANEKLVETISTTFLSP